MAKLLLYSLLVGSSLFAADLQTSTRPDREAVYNISAGFGPAALLGAVGVGLTAGIAREVSPGYPFFMGLDVGLHIWNYNRGERDALKSFPMNEEGTVTAMELLPTFYYKAFIPMMPAAVPFVGISLGPTIYSTHMTGTQSTTVYAQVMIRSGLQVIFSEASAVILEPKLGFLGSSFLFAPQISAQWML